MAGAPA